MALDMHLQSLLIEMYGRCGLIDKAHNVFVLVEKGIRDIVIWTSMLGAYSKNGMCGQVIGLYEKMLSQGTKPDNVVFVTVLTACSHSGDLTRGLEYFESMARDFGLSPQAEHWSCVVDMMCRAGEVDKAWELVSELSKSGTATVTAWGALLSACGECGSVEMGKKAAEKALELDPTNVGIYVVLSNLYAGAGMWEEISKLRALMKERRLRKDFACSKIESTMTNC